MRDVTALVVPPFSLSKSLMDRINENYQVVEMAQLDLVELEPVYRRRSAQPVLVVLSSMEQITEQSRLCNLKLYAYKCDEVYKNEPANNFYLGAEKFYAH